MRWMITLLAAATVASLAVAAQAAPAKKNRAVAEKDRARAAERARERADALGYDASPEHYRVGSREWWRAMDREGRGGFGDTP